MEDYIVKKNNDTIRCNIYAIDENNIFYHYFNSNQTYKRSYIQLEDTKAFMIKNENKILTPSRDTTHYRQKTKFCSIGLGAGLNYGGFGSCVAVVLNDAELFLAGGYNLLEFSYNAGLYKE